MRATIPAAVNPAGTTGCPDAVSPRTRFFDIRLSSSLIRTGQVAEACTRTGAVRRHARLGVLHLDPVRDHRVGRGRRREEPDPVVTRAPPHLDEVVGRDALRPEVDPG